MCSILSSLETGQLAFFDTVKPRCFLTGGVPPLVRRLLSCRSAFIRVQIELEYPDSPQRTIRVNGKPLAVLTECAPM